MRPTTTIGSIECDAHSLEVAMPATMKIDYKRELR